MKQHVLQVFGSAVDYLRQQLARVDPTQAAVMPRAAGGVTLNPPAFLVPHVALSIGQVAQALGEAPAVPGDWFKKYDMGCTPSDDLAFYPAWERSIAVLDAAVRQATRLVEAATPEQLARPVTAENLRALMPTVGDAVVFVLVFHTAIHTGQLTAWLRCMGEGPRF